MLNCFREKIAPCSPLRKREPVTGWFSTTNRSSKLSCNRNIKKDHIFAVQEIRTNQQGNRRKPNHVKVRIRVGASMGSWLNLSIRILTSKAGNETPHENWLKETNESFDCSKPETIHQSSGNLVESNLECSGREGWGEEWSGERQRGRETDYGLNSKFKWVRTKNEAMGIEPGWTG